MATATCLPRNVQAEMVQGFTLNQLHQIQLSGLPTILNLNFKHYSSFFISGHVLGGRV
jgi:hypothetical protein